MRLIFRFILCLHIRAAFQIVLIMFCKVLLLFRVASIGGDLKAAVQYLHTFSSDVMVSRRSDRATNDALKNFNAVHVLFSNDFWNKFSVFIKDFHWIVTGFEQVFHLSELMFPQFLPQKLAKEYRSVRRGRRFLRVQNHICKIKNLRFRSGSNLFRLWVLSSGARGCVCRRSFFLVRVLRV